MKRISPQRPRGGVFMVGGDNVMFPSKYYCYSIIFVHIVRGQIWPTYDGYFENSS